MLVTSQAREESHKRIDQLPDYLFHSCQLQNYINIKHDIFIVFILFIFQFDFSLDFKFAGVGFPKGALSRHAHA